MLVTRTQRSSCRQELMYLCLLAAEKGVGKGLQFSHVGLTPVVVPEEVSGGGRLLGAGGDVVGVEVQEVLLMLTAGCRGVDGHGRPAGARPPRRVHAHVVVEGVEVGLLLHPAAAPAIRACRARARAGDVLVGAGNGHGDGGRVVGGRGVVVVLLLAAVDVLLLVRLVVVLLESCCRCEPRRELGLHHGQLRLQACDLHTQTRAQAHETYPQ